MMDLDMASTPLFSCGLDLASLVVSCDLLHHSWGAISDLQANPCRQDGSAPVSVEYRVSQVKNYRIIAFVASHVTKLSLQEGSDLVPSSDIPNFRFLCSKSNPRFSINRAAKDHFDSICSELYSLKAQVVEGARSTRYLITGNSLGGLVASLFTLWLLDALDAYTTKRPLCITFGSPLLGDLQFQQAISHYSAWDSYFLHVIHRDDPFSSLFPAKTYRPFGTFLFLSASGSACFEASESISELLERMRLERSGDQQLQEFDYGPTVDRLRENVVCRDGNELSWREIGSYKAGVITQLTAIGLPQDEQQNNKSRNSWVDKNIVKPEKAAIIRKKETFDLDRRLSSAKVNLAMLEWYKKISEIDGHVYYDCYKTKRQKRDHKVEEFKRILTDYWERVVEEVEKKSQKEERRIRKRWLYAGTNFRRMVEPLEIAEYYKVKGRRDYWNGGRLNCYKKLEEWLEESRRPEINLITRKRTIKSSITEDSCFWAHVEEAMISCKAYKNGEGASFERLVGFESYMLGLIERYLVSAEIFIPESSYMKWWKEYEGIVTRRSAGGEGSYDSKLIRFMRNGQYHDYKEGRYDPLEDE